MSLLKLQCNSDETNTRGVKVSDEILTDLSYKEFIPFMRDFADDIGYDKSINIDASALIGAYPYFRLKTTPPRDKLRSFSSQIGVFSIKIDLFMTY